MCTSYSAAADLSSSLTTSCQQQQQSLECDCLEKPDHDANTGVRLSRQCIGFVRNRDSAHSEPVTKFTWTNGNLMTASVMTYGATVMEILVPDRWAESADVLLGFDTLDEYVEHIAGGHRFGAAVGRCAGIIVGAEYEHRKCDVVQLTGNMPKGNGQSGDGRGDHEYHQRGHHLDGGHYGLDQVNWSAYTPPGVDGHHSEVIMSHVSPDGDEGYPGSLMVQIRFRMTDDNRFHISYMAQTDRRTPVNVSHRLYMNLAGHGAGNQALLDHVMAVNAIKRVEFEEDYGQRLDDIGESSRRRNVPTGKLLPIGGTEYDCRVADGLEARIRRSTLGVFREMFVVAPNTLRREIATATKQMPTKRMHSKAPTANFVTRVVHPASGRVLEIYSSQRCVEFSTGDRLPVAPLPLLEDDEQSLVDGLTEADTVAAMCTTIVDDIVDDITDTGRYLRKSLLRQLIDRVCELKMSADGSIPTDVAMGLLHEVCQELRILQEAEEEGDGEELGEEEEEKDVSKRPIEGKGGAKYVQNSGFYAQMQNFPDAVHHRGRFGDVMLEPGQTYRHELVYKFGLHMGGVRKQSRSSQRRTTDTDMIE